MGLLEGKTALVFGLANDRSIAWGITQALGIDRHLNGADLCDPQSELWVESGEAISDESVTIGPRVGLYSVPEPWKSVAWRFLVRAQS